MTGTAGFAAASLRTSRNVQVSASHFVGNTGVGLALLDTWSGTAPASAGHRGATLLSALGHELPCAIVHGPGVEPLARPLPLVEFRRSPIRRAQGMVRHRDEAW